MHRFLAVLHARNLEFLRDRAALSWNVLLPVFLVLGFAFLFSGEEKTLYKVGLYGADGRSSQSLSARGTAFFDTKYIEFISVADLSRAIVKVQHHQLDMLIDLSSGPRYWVNSSSANGYVLERVLWGTSAGDEGRALTKETVSGREIRYVDWVIPGILAMNMMFSCLFGIGYVIVRYRKNGVLKRLKATPLTAVEFLSAQVLSRLLLIIAITVVVFIGTDLLVDFVMLGSYATLLLVFVLGALCLICLALTLAARTASEEFAGGALNLLAWPMMIFSGVWFSLEGLHPLARAFAQTLPLTHIVDAARAVMNDGATLVDIFPNLLVLALMSVIFLAIGARTFRWE
ncbi:MAG: ABC transporter permease [Gammaproteobacteria bacterium SG8_47]|nr:MAG: ABC transporter permease [Gammaproteobacteria bacterium SG8_47]